MIMKSIHVSWMWLIVLILALMPLLDLLHPGLPVTHDGQDHVARIANFYQSLSEGNVVPRWAANLNWGYGHPILMFLYPLPSYIASLFHAIGFSFIDSTKLVFAVSYIASIVTMYLWIRAAWGSVAGFTAAILYGFAPYRFVDLYVRGAIGEHVAFIFPPLICYALVRKKYWLITLGTTFLILSHNALSLVFFPFILLYAFYLVSQEKKQRIRLTVFSALSIIFGFMLSAFYWVPAFFEGKYTLRDIVTAGEFSDRFVPWLTFFYSPWSYGGGDQLSKWLGAGQILVLIMSFVSAERYRQYRRLLIVSIFLLFLVLFAMTKQSSPLWEVVTLLQKFQFPWRLLSAVTFLLAFIGAVVAVRTPERQRTWVAIVVCVVSVVSTILMWRAREYKTYPGSFFTGIYHGTTDTGESSPIWSVRFMESRPEQLAFLVPPIGTVTPRKRTTTEREYRVEVSTPVRFIENTLYFPGWQVFINDTRLPHDRLIFQDPTYRGLMTFDLEQGEYNVRFVFTDTKLRKMSNLISLGALVVFLLTIGILLKLRYESV